MGEKGQTQQQSESQEQQIVVFDLAGEAYGVDINAVLEIIRMEEITGVPETANFVEGVINIRGKVIPVVDLRKRFGLEHGEVSKDNRIVVVDIASQSIGMIVDAVNEVMRISEDSIEPPSLVITNEDSEYLIGIAKLEGRMIILLDLERVLSGSQQDSITTLVGAAAA